MIDYLTFEAEYTQAEMDVFESSGSEVDRAKALSKRLESMLVWEEMGNTVPRSIRTFKG